MLDRITFDPNIMGGRACIRGMRIPVSVIIGQIANGATVKEILKDYPDLEPEDIKQALEYAAWLTQEEVHLVEKSYAIKPEIFLDKLKFSYYN
jgi:uncharacterized protein (DUF433 family)